VIRILFGGALFVGLAGTVGPMGSILVAGAVLVVLLLVESWLAIRERDQEIADRETARWRWAVWHG
jgi:high-affinity Fe2+/Pb2+ permease